MGWNWTPECKTVSNMFRLPFPKFYQWRDRLVWGRAFHCIVNKIINGSFEVILIGDFLYTAVHCRSFLETKYKVVSKWTFDLLQFKQEPTRVTEIRATLIDHVYSSNSVNISNCFVSKLSVSDHFSRRKKNPVKMPKHNHIMTSYRFYKKFKY